MKGASSGRGPIVTGCLQAPVPAVQGPGQRDASNLETEPVAGTREKRETLRFPKTWESILPVSHGRCEMVLGDMEKVDRCLSEPKWRHEVINRQ